MTGGVLNTPGHHLQRTRTGASDLNIILISNCLVLSLLVCYIVVFFIKNIFLLINTWRKSITSLVIFLLHFIITIIILFSQYYFIILFSIKLVLNTLLTILKIFSLRLMKRILHLLRTLQSNAKLQR